MRTSAVLIAVVLLTGFAGVVLGNSFTYYFDENGNSQGTLGLVSTDPLVYNLQLDNGQPNSGPFGQFRTEGYLVLTEPGFPDIISDIVWFENAPDYKCLIHFFSAPGGSDYADQGTWPTPQGNVLTLPEQVTESGWSGIVYAPSPDQPGSFLDVFGEYQAATYHITSDVPEPATLLLMGTGALGVFGWIRRKRSK